MTPELDARFGELAADRIRAHPVRYCVVLPLLRVTDMWLRPRIEILPPDPRWWEFNDDTKQSVLAVGFGLLNLAYVAAALLAVVYRPSGRPSRGPSGIRWAGLLISFVLLRSAFLGVLENPEPRYTLECYPVVILWAAAYLAQATEQRPQSESQILKSRLAWREFQNTVDDAQSCTANSIRFSLALTAHHVQYCSQVSVRTR